MAIPFEHPHVQRIRVPIDPPTGPPRMWPRYMDSVFGRPPNLPPKWKPGMPRAKRSDAGGRHNYPETRKPEV